MSKHHHKDYYTSLGVTNKATQAYIENAYQRLAAQWHPEKHPGDRVKAQRKFNEISEAYYNLSNPARRDHYDHITHDYSTEDAYKTFERFYDQHGFNDYREKEFFEKHYPYRKRSYYEVLGVPRNASFHDIQRAYREQALKYHPKNNTDKDAEQRFREINEAYTHLSEANKRANYDDYRFGELVPFNSHSIFNEFFGTRPFVSEDDFNFFKPILSKTPSQIQREVYKDWVDINSLGPETEFAESYKSSTFHEKGPQGVTGKTITEKSSIRGGKKVTVKTEEILKPDGTKEITETVLEGGDTRTSRYLQAPGEDKKALGN